MQVKNSWEIQVLQQELLSLCYDEQTSALPRASTYLGGKSRSRTPKKHGFSNKNSSPSAMTRRLPHCHGDPPAWVEHPGQELREIKVLQQELLSLCYDEQTSALPRASTCLGGTSRSRTQGIQVLQQELLSLGYDEQTPHCPGHPPTWVGNPRQELLGNTGSPTRTPLPRL